MQLIAQILRLTIIALYTILRFHYFWYFPVQEEETPKRFIDNIKAALNVIQQNIPRVLVSLMSILHVELVRVIDADEPFCKYLHTKECGCADDPTFTAEEMIRLENGYTAVSN